MILETVRLLQNPDVVRAALGNPDRVLDLSTDPLLRFQKVTLSPTDGYVLSRVDGVMKAREIVEMIPLPQEEVEKSLYGLLCTGIIEFAPMVAKAAPDPRRRQPAERGHAAPAPGRRPPRRRRPTPGARTTTRAARRSRRRRKEILEAFDGLKTKNHFEVLGIPRASSEAQVKEAYFQLAKRFHPDTHHDPAMDDLGPKLEAVFIRLGQAYEVLRNPRTRGPYEADLASRTTHFPRPGGRRHRARNAAQGLARRSARNAAATRASRRSRAGDPPGLRGDGRGREAHGAGKVLGRDPAPRARRPVAGGRAT